MKPPAHFFSFTPRHKRLRLMRGAALFLFVLFLYLAVFLYPAQDRGETRRQLPAVQLPPQTAALLKDGQWQEAIAALSDIYGVTGTDPNIKYVLAYCHEQLAATAFQQKKYREAIDRLEQAVSYVKDDPEIFMELGLCHFLLSQYPEAEENFKETLGLDPNHCQAHKKLGEIYYLTGDTEKAMQHWVEALRLDPADKGLEKRLQNVKRYLEMTPTLETEIDSFFSVSFDGNRDERLGTQVLEILENAYRTIGRELNLYPNRQIRVVLVTKQDFFDITGSPEWVAGVYEGQIKVPVENVDPELLKMVLCHEYVHAVLYDRMANRCPWWLNEGLAQYFSGDENRKRLTTDMAAALTAVGDIPSLNALPGTWLQDKTRAQVAYLLALSGVRFFLEKFTVFQLQAVLDLLGEGKSLDSALEEITGYTYIEFETEWKETL